MSDALLTVLSFAVVLTSLTALLGASLGATGKSTEAWVAESRGAYSASIGDIEALTAVALGSAGTTIVDVTVENTGSSSYADWDKWDVSVQYTTTTGNVSIQRLSHATTLAAGKWAVNGIYLDAVTTAEEGVEPDVLNPAEQMVMRLQMSPAAGSGTTGMVVITTQDGLSARIYFES